MEKEKILFLDDEERIVNLLKMMFRRDYDVYTAIDGHEALKIIEDNDILVVVSDQRMPNMTGIEFLAQVRKRSPGTMRILLTGYSELTAIVGSVNDGEVFRFVNKPWDQKEIKEIVAEAVSAAKQTWNSLPASNNLHDDELDSQSFIDNEKTGNLLILDDDADCGGFKELFGKKYCVFHARSIADALHILSSEVIGVIVTESVVGGEDTAIFLKMLKMKYPVITTVLLTNTVDSDLVINLINQAQIYRFASKPVRKTVLELAVIGAFRQHQHLCEDPILRSRYKVEETSEVEYASSLGKSIMSGLLNIASRWKIFSRSR